MSWLVIPNKAKIKFTASHFVAFWLFLNILQGSFTELTSDEGYYWFYSTSLQWGYYDHPPLLAWLIGAGYLLIQNELGVRLFNIFMNAAGLLLFFKLVSPYIKNWPIAFVLILSMPLLNYLSFIVFPDGPLLFFTIIFLLTYREYLERKDLRSSLLMGMSLALMLYSKYHGLLILIFTAASNLSLLRSKLFYLSVAIAFILFLPHLAWQYENDYPSFQYHLSGRMSYFSISHVLQYLSQQLLVVGPALIFIPFFYKAANQFERTLKFIVFGTFIFFLLASLRAFIHFHWTSIVIFPLMFLAVRFYSSLSRLTLLYWLAVPVMVIVLAARLQLMLPFIPVNHVNVDYYHGRKSWAGGITNLTDRDTVLFQDNFREASLFSFYSKKTGVTIFSEANRKSQYDLWHCEDGLQHKSLFYIRYEPFNGANEYISPIGKTIYYTTLANFSSYFDVEINAACIEPQDKADSMSVCIDVKNTRQRALLFKRGEDGIYPVLYYKVLSKKNIVQRGPLKVFSDVDSLSVQSTVRIQTKIPVSNLKRGRYRVIFGFQFGKLKESENGEIVIKRK